MQAHGLSMPLEHKEAGPKPQLYCSDAQGRTRAHARHPYLYLLVHRPTASPAHELFGGLARVDVQTGSLLEADLGCESAPGEALLPLAAAPAVPRQLTQPTLKAAEVG